MLAAYLRCPLYHIASAVGTVKWIAVDGNPVPALVMRSRKEKGAECKHPAPEGSRAVYGYARCLSAAWAAANRATGTLNGEQLT